MKRYSISIAHDVDVSIRQAFFYIHERSPQNAAQWLSGLYRAIDTLETMPERCALVRENDAFEEDVRELLYHSHRIIFTINEPSRTVCVHAFRHSAQDELTPPD